MQILIISGKSASGKDTAADIMRANAEKHGLKTITIHYADCVKFFATKYYNWNGEKDIAGRTLLQELGTNKVRKNFPDYWSEIVAKFLASIPNDFDLAFIPDARFPNEISIVKAYNPHAKVLRINRYNEDGTPFVNPALTIEQLHHPSETSLDNHEELFDYVVNNQTGKWNDLVFNLDNILKDFDLF